MAGGSSIAVVVVVEAVVVSCDGASGGSDRLRWRWSKDCSLDQGHTCPCKLLDELFLHHIQLSSINGDTCHIDLTSSNSSLHNLSCCWLLTHRLFLFLIVFLVVFLGLFIVMINAAFCLERSWDLSYLWRSKARSCY